MCKKLNKKGFTLIELLATVVILAVVSSVTIVAVTSYYKKGREKAEEIFVEQLKDYVKDYISLYGSSHNFSESLGEKNKCYKTIEGDGYNCNNKVILYRDPSSKDLDNIMENMTNKDILNPNTKASCTEHDKVTLYRDSDYVYCFVIEANSVDTCVPRIDSLYDETSGKYKIDTCSEIYKVEE